MKHELLDNSIKSLILSLKKKGKDEKKDFLVAISDELDTSRRRRNKVNIFKLSILAKRHKDKIFLVPGSVLGYGIVDTPVNVYAYKYSKNAAEKISKAKGNAKTFEDLLSAKLESKDVIIIK